jgi:hypothetical protein
MPGIFTGIFGRPKATPQPITGRAVGFGLNQFPPATGGPGIVRGRVTGLPSPSVGTVLAQSRTVPPQPLQAYPLATPTVGASFGAIAQAPVSLGGVSSHVSNSIGSRH